MSIDAYFDGKKVTERWVIKVIVIVAEKRNSNIFIGYFYFTSFQKNFVYP